MKEKLVIILWLAFAVGRSSAQRALPLATNLTHCYQAGTRDLNGLPGKAYWQNRADYDLSVEFDPASRVLRGTVGIDYTNNSPDTLKRLLFKLYPNLYQAQAMRSVAVAPEDLGEGMSISAIRLGGRILDSTHRKIKGTNMNLTGLTVLPHARVHLELAYSYTLNKGSFIRTGQIDTGSFFIAYFFPRIAVYDDLDGWNEYPYSGQYEFYNDYGDFRLAITLPASYLAWATGDLENADSIYAPSLLDRIHKAVQNDTIADLVTAADWRAGGLTRGNTVNHWVFLAKNVTDVAFALSNHYNWRASGIEVGKATGRRSRVDAVYSPEHPGYAQVADYARKTVGLIGTRLPGIGFPYSHITIVDGLDAMEYPMMVNNLPFEQPADAVEFTAHEVFHSLLPFYVGVNETKYSFLDEGLATMAEFTLHPLIDAATPVSNNTGDVDRSAGSEQDVPIMTLTPQLLGAARYADKDMKPALGFFYVRELLGEEAFNKALRYFIEAWAGKHPTPYDFFHCMNAGARRNLNWFWRNWFFQKYAPDLAISKVETNGPITSITIVRKGEAMVPIHLVVHYSDSSSFSVTRTISCWSDGRKSIAITIPTRREIVRVELGAPYDADIDHSNNVWRLTP